MPLATLADVADPVETIFGVPALELFKKTELFAVHGGLERFPDFMRKGALESIESLGQSYNGPLEVSNGSADDGLQTPVTGVHPLALLRLGLTVVFTDLKRAVPQAPGWLRDLEASLGLPECAAMLAFANAKGSGLSLHHDRYDQLFFQLRGEKQFRYAPNGYVEHPDVQFTPFSSAHANFAQTYRRGFPANSHDVLQKNLRTLDLRPGSAFFMPSGTWHTTSDQAGDSLSVVVALRAPSNLDVVLNLVRYYASQSSAWRARSYGGWSASASLADPPQANLARLMADLAERMKALPAGDAFKAWLVHGYTVGSQTQYPATLRCERFIRLPNSSLRYADDPQTGKLRCIVRAGPTNRPQAETVLSINSEARQIVDWVLASQAQFSVAALEAAFTDFSREDLEDLLGWLARAALIRAVPAPDWD